MRKDKNNPMYNKHHSIEARKKMSLAHLGKSLSKEHRKKIGLANIGRIITKETREKISLAKKGHKVSKQQIEKGIRTFKKNYKKENHPFWHKKHKLKSKEKMSKAHKGKNLRENNPAWKGDETGYYGIHVWVRKHKPKSEICEFCNKNKKFEDLELANITGIYNRDFSNYKWFCTKCHKDFDFPDGRIGKNIIK